MLGKSYDGQVCSAARALELVGERWSLLIIRDALYAGATRYSDFQKRLGVATNVLQNRLDGFVGAGLMERRRGARNPEGSEYLLTEKGRDLASVIIALTEWGDRWAAPDGPPVRYTHSPCGGQVSQHIVCSTCGQEVDATDIHVQPGAGMPEELVLQLRERQSAQRP